MERDQIVGAVAGGLVALSALLPWASFWIVTVTGLDGDGVFSGIAGLAGVLFSLTVQVKKARRALVVLCGAVAAYVGGYHMWFGVGSVDGASIGLGLYGTLLGGILLGLVGLIGTGRGATPAPQLPPPSWGPPNQ